MRLVLGVIFMGFGIANLHGQTLYATAEVIPEIKKIEENPPTVLDPVTLSPEPSVNRPRVWVHFDYLLWRITNGPIAVPVLTVNSNPNSIAALNEPGTRVLVGGSSNKVFDFDWMNGLRLSAGGWLDSEGTLGLEFTGFELAPNSMRYRANSVGDPGPVLGIPLNAVTPFGGNPAGETSLNPGGVPSTVRIRGSTEAWNGEINLLMIPEKNPEFSWGVLFGGRFLNLRERFELSDVFYDNSNAGTVAVRDGFNTENNFAGVNLGGLAQWNFGRWQTSVGGKIALGVVQQKLSIRGETVVNGSPFGLDNVVFPGGVFAQSSNIGNYTQERFGVLPEANFRLGFAVTQNFRVSLGYDAMFLNSVLRPGQQLDRNINVNQSVLFGNGSTSGPQRPGAALQDSSIWMHGIHLGVGFSY